MSDEILRRIFEPMPAGWERMFQAGDQVELVRSYMMWAEIPVGAVGVIKAVGQDGPAGAFEQKLTVLITPIHQKP